MDPGTDLGRLECAQERRRRAPRARGRWLLAWPLIFSDDVFKSAERLALSCVDPKERSD